MKYLRIAYKFSLESIPEVSQVRLLYKDNRYQQASGLLDRCFSIFSNMRGEQKDTRIEFYTTALEHQLYLKKYQSVNSILQQLFTLNPSLANRYLVEYYLTSEILNKKPSKLDVDPKIHQIVSKTAKNIIHKNLSSIISPEEIPEEYYKLSERIGILAGVSNYLSFAKELKFKARPLEITEAEQSISPMIHGLNLKYKTDINKNGHGLVVDSTLKKLKGYTRQLFPISYLVYNSKCYDRKELGNWATLFLKHSQIHCPNRLYRPLALMSMLLFNSQNYLSSQGLIASAFDHIEKQQRLKRDTQIMLGLCKAKILHQIKGREKEAEQIRGEYLKQFDEKQLLFDMIL